MNQDKIKNRIDHRALTFTLAVQTKSKKDEAMIAFIKEKLSKKEVTIQEDDYGNIYVIKGEAASFPCVVAHMDTVHDVLTDVNIFRSDDTLFAFDPIKRSQTGIGGDDKVGVYIALQLLEDIQNIKAVFFRDEEIGCLGSDYSITHHKEWYKDCGFVVMADRRGNEDVITVSGGVVITSEQFLSDCSEIFKKYNYKETVGILTDVDVLTTGGIGVSTVNFSCGYFHPHSSHEIVSISDVNRCYNLMYDIIIEHGDKRFPYKAQIPSYISTRKEIKTAFSAFRKHNKNSRALLSDIISNGIATPVKRQPKLFSGSIFGNQTSAYTLFTEHDVIGQGKKVYMYTGAKALPLTGEVTCPHCKYPAIENILFLPYEGRMYCTKCNDYVSDKHVETLLQFLEVVDNGEVFVYSLYSAGWILKKDAKWTEKVTSWVSTELPF